MASIVSQDLNAVISSTDESSGSDFPIGSNAIKRRIFIGPLPERVIAHAESRPKRAKPNIGSVFSLTSDVPVDQAGHNVDKSEEVTRVLRDNAYKFFLHHGGKPDDWKEGEEADMIDELVQRWKTSEWGQLWGRRHRQQQNEPQSSAPNGWFGTSFEVGTLLGVDVIQIQGHLNSLAVRSRAPGASLMQRDNAAPLTTDQGTSAIQTFATPLTNTTQIDTDVTSSASINNQALQDVLVPATSRDSLLPSRTEGLATTPSQSGSQRIDPTPRIHIDPPLKAHEKGKAKVHYADTAMEAGLTTPGSVPPEEALGGTLVPNVSLAATVAPEAMTSPTPSEFRWGDIVLRDRMLVRIDYTKFDTMAQFDDSINRTTRNLEYEDWGEFLVVWRRDSIEIYKDYSTPWTEWATGHKQLAFVIPLKAERTRLSLYSFVDLTFCITCSLTTSTLNENTTRWGFSRAKEGTGIFVFKLRSRSRAYDWYWQLWRHLGGVIPRSIEVHNPRLNTRVTIDIPDSDGPNNNALYRFLRRDNIIGLCVESVENVPDYKYLLESALESGKSLQLAWRYQANLDWVWLDEDVFGKPREWSVLCGLALKHSTRTPVLEVRLAEHGPTTVHLKDGRKIEEPPAIEGYLERIRPNRQAKHMVYLSTHAGYLFSLNTVSPFPPSPPGPVPTFTDTQASKHSEIRRGINQIITATSTMDLRTILAVRRAFQPAPPHVHDVKEQDDDNGWFAAWVQEEERSSEDEVDEGGEAALANSTQIRIRRSFELLLNTGHVLRFEAYSCKLAIEWIERLRALIFYWKRRHRVDAKQEIELAQAQRPRLTPLTRVCQDENEVLPEAPEEAAQTYATADTLYNWCILEGCKPIIKGGRIYMRKGLSGQYQLVQLFLVAGHLVRFRIGAQMSQYPFIKKKINLLEAYVCSGYFAAQTLPRGQYSPNAAPAPRRYGDGLETDDREEDMIFMIWYRPHPQMLHADQDPTTTPVDGKIPRLSKKFKVLQFKTRSVLERDAWCWAINSEIEKIMRTQAGRETRLRDTGNLVTLAGL